jgi:hypothetical protein
LKNQPKKIKNLTPPETEEMNRLHRHMIERLIRKYENEVDLDTEIPEDQMEKLQNEVHLVKMESSKYYTDD